MPAPPAPDPELEALGLKVFGPHQHRGQYPEPHYRKDVSRLWLENRIPSDQEMEQRRSAPGVVSVEIVDDILPVSRKPSKCLVITQLIDLWSQADERAWKEEMAGKYLVQGDIGKYKGSGHGSAERGLPSRGRPTIGEGCAHVMKMYASPDGAYFYADIYVCERNPALLEHEFATRVLDDGAGLKRVGRQFVVSRASGEEGLAGAMWLSANGVYVAISNAGRHPGDVVAKYLEKHPSVLPDGFEVDPAQWLEIEIGYRFRWMDEALGMADVHQACLFFSEQCHFVLKRLPAPIENKERKSIDECRRDREIISTWWEANKSKLRWNRKTKKFEVKE
jgi:hypothetical protein